MKSMMKVRRTIFSFLGVLFYIIGVLIGLALCLWAFWGGIEGLIFVPRTAERTLRTLRCPLMLSASETGIVTASFNNPTSETINPTIRAEVSQAHGTRSESVILPLAPGEGKELQWTVTPDNKVFNGLILVSIYESSQHDFPSHQSSCGIPIAPLPGLTGKQTFSAIVATSLLLIACGAILWLGSSVPLKDSKLEATRASGVLTVIVLAGMAFTILRWWVPGGLLSLFAVLMIVILVTQFTLSPS